MLLTIDVGNTNITIGIFKEDDLVASFRLNTKTPRTSDELGILMHDLMRAKGLDPHEITDAIISSVVPKIMHSLTNSIRKFFNVEPLIVGPGTKTGIHIKTDNPKEVGADRIVNATAAYTTYGCDCLIVDFGTATTFDFVSGEGVFEYTVIVPGVEIAAQALVSQTAKLPEVEIIMPDSILAKNTITGMQSGIVLGYLGQVEYIIKRMKQELKRDMKVIATGGLGKMFASVTDLIETYDGDLAYRGMKIIYEKNKGVKKA